MVIGGFFLMEWVIRFVVVRFDSWFDSIEFEILLIACESLWKPVGLVCRLFSMIVF